jgi:hypothetical protein
MTMSDEMRRIDDHANSLDDFISHRVIRNYSAHRRWSFINTVLLVVLGVVAGILIERVDANTRHIDHTAHRSEQAICYVIGYAEDQSKNLTMGPAARELRNLATKMRNTGVNCPP